MKIVDESSPTSVQTEQNLKCFSCLPSVQAGTLLMAGMGMFCGALYHQALTGDPGLRKVAPMGGMAMIVGWLAIVL